MRRKISRIEFHNDLAVGWAFGVSRAFKEALGIAATERALSGRGGLLAELSKGGADVPNSTSNLMPNEISDLLRKAGLTVINITARPDAKGSDHLFAVIETEADPPHYEFSAGDIFYEPPKVRHMKWGEAEKIIKRCIQITAADNDHVTASLWTYKSHKRSKPSSFSCTQTEFADLLRTGSLKASQAAEA